MKPFLTLQDGFLEMYNDFLAVTHPFGEFSRTDTNPIKKGGPLCDIADQAVREARSRFSQLKALGAAKAQTQIVESAWTAVRLIHADERPETNLDAGSLQLHQDDRFRRSGDFCAQESCSRATVE